MKKILSQLPKILIALAMAGLLSGGLTSCKSKKKLAREKIAAEYAKKIDKAKHDLTAIINGTTEWSLDQQAKQLQTIKNYNIDDPDIKTLIVKAEDKINALKADRERSIEEERLKHEEEAKKRAARSQFAVFNNAFETIATANNLNMANSKINDVLHLFASPDVPILIIINQTNGINDYDRPTTALRFLNYLKDKQSYNFEVESIKKDSFGKITELELIKK